MSEYKKDYLFAAIGIVIWVSSIPMAIGAVWVDARWGWTALIALPSGFLAMFISIKMDERYKNNGNRK